MHNREKGDEGRQILKHANKFKRLYTIKKNNLVTKVYAFGTFIYFKFKIAKCYQKCHTSII